MVATIRGWPLARATVDALREQLEPLGGEIIVMDGGSGPQPTRDELGPAVRWLRRPGESVFQLRHAGYAETTGDIVAVTEDHCVPAPGWADAILRAHTEHPEAIAVGGAVRNATTHHAIDWAAFIVTQTPYVAPLPSGPIDRIAGVAAVSYKRRALERRPDHGDLGSIELFDTAELRRDGETLVNDERIAVLHHQSMGLAGTAATEYPNGRTVAGFRRQKLGLGDVARVVAFPILPVYRWGRSVRMALRKEIPRSAVLRAVPLVLFLHYCQGAGELMGYLAGPGSSPGRLV